MLTGDISQTNQAILIIDDSPTNIEFLHDALDSAGYKVLVAMDGYNGIETVKNHHPDLILLDVMMRGIDGFETCRQLKSQSTTCDIPIIFMTALNDTTDKIRGLALGAVDYIIKPFQQEEVLARVGLHLKLRQANLELSQQKDILEQRVKERTAELSQALDDFKHAQLQLVQNEKMATLGNLVAGVAHEINNPLGFLKGSISHAQEYIQDILKYINCTQKYHSQLPNLVPDLAEQINLEYLCEDLPKLLSSMSLASKRIEEISNSLRIFSRADTPGKIACNLHEGIESTLLILKYRLQANHQRPAIKIIKKYGDLPKIKCFLGQLNQVFTNIIANAIDALDMSIVGKKSVDIPDNSLQITIATKFYIDENLVSISISDNAGGIPEEIKAHIFDNLFTTKEVGKGTGLGLAIAKQIIEEIHGGKLICNSVLNRGTEFIIQIPNLI